MNERVVFFLCLLVAEFGASAMLFLLRPESPVTRGHLSLLSYAGAHAVPALGVWFVLSGLSAGLMPKLWRRRQNRSTKFSLFVRLGVLGLAIDLAGSLYLLMHQDETIVDHGSPVSSLLMRLGCYALGFAATVVVADQVAEWHARRHPPATPPPRFGRT